MGSLIGGSFSYFTEVLRALDNSMSISMARTSLAAPKWLVLIGLVFIQPLNQSNVLS